MRLLIALAAMAVNLCTTGWFVAAMLVHLHRQISARVQLPVSPASIPHADPVNTLRLVLKADKIIYLADQPIPDASLPRLIQERAPERVLLRADHQVPYPRVKAVLRELGAVGVGKITFQVDNGEPASPPIATPAAAALSSPAGTQ